MSSWLSISIRMEESWILQSCVFSIHDLSECVHCRYEIDALKISIFSWQITLPLKTTWKVHKYFHIGLRRRKRTGIWLRDKSDRFCFFMGRIMSKKGKLLRKVTWPGLRDEQPKWMYIHVGKRGERMSTSSKSGALELESLNELLQLSLSSLALKQLQLIFLLSLSALWKYLRV